MHSPTLKDRVPSHRTQCKPGDKDMIIGLPYSILASAQQPGASWTPSAHTQRVKPDESAVDVAVTQACWLARQLPAQTTYEIAFDDG